MHRVRIGSSVILSAQLVKTCGLDLPDALTCQVQQFTDLFKRDASTVCHVQRAGLREFPHLKVGEVELDGARVWVDIQEEVELTRDEGAGTFGLAALRAASRTTLLDLLQDRFGLLALLRRQPLQGYGLASPQALTGSSFVRCSATLWRGVAHEGNPGVGCLGMAHDEDVMASLKWCGWETLAQLSLVTLRLICYAALDLPIASRDLKTFLGPG